MLFATTSEAIKRQIAFIMPKIRAEKKSRQHREVQQGRVRFPIEWRYESNCLHAGWLILDLFFCVCSYVFQEYISRRNSDSIS